MKFLILQVIATIVMFSNPAGAAVTILEARMGQDAVQVDVVYGGGCKEHTFSLKKMVCTRTTPMTCSYELIDEVQDDPCRALVHQTVELPLTEEVLSGNVEQMILMDSQKEFTVLEI